MKTQHFNLITHLLCPYVQRSVITLEEKQIPYIRTDIDLANKPEWFTKISPLGKVPVLKVEDMALFESAVICEYIDEVTPGSLHPKDPLKKAVHRSWIEFGSAMLQSIGGLYNAADITGFEARLDQIRGQFSQLENGLQGTPFFSGNCFHLIDAVYGPVFRYFDVFDQITELDLFRDLPRVSTWRSALGQRPSVKAAVSPSYSGSLLQFLAKRESYLSCFVRSSLAA